MREIYIFLTLPFNYHLFEVKVYDFDFDTYYTKPLKDYHLNYNTYNIINQSHIVIMSDALHQ